MRAAGLCLALVALLAAAGCRDDDCSGIGPPVPPAPGPGLILVGEPVRLSIEPVLPFTCQQPEQLFPTGLSVELSDPDNLPLAHQASLGAQPHSAATVRFTAAQAGRHHVLAAFEPVGGIHQFELHAARDRSAEAPLHTLSRQCGALERTGPGAWVCDREVLRGDTLVRRFSSGRLAVAEQVVWVVEDTQLQRFVDTGTTLELTASLPLAQGPVEFLLASADELVLVHASSLQRIAFDGAALASTGTTGWTPSATPLMPLGPKAVLLRAGERLALVSRAGASSRTPPQACAYRLESGRLVRTAEGCQPLPGEVVGFEPSALWMADPSSTSGRFSALRRLEWTGGGLVEQAALALGLGFQPSNNPLGQRQSAVPVLLAGGPGSRTRSAVAVHSPQRQALLLEHLDAEQSEPLASTTLLWGAPRKAGTSPSSRIRLRASTP